MCAGSTSWILLLDRRRLALTMGWPRVQPVHQRLEGQALDPGRLAQPGREGTVGRVLAELAVTLELRFSEPLIERRLLGKSGVLEAVLSDVDGFVGDERGLEPDDHAAPVVVGGARTPPQRAGVLRRVEDRAH